jgi:tetratricopeptide (TPR) repeat protein
MPAHANALGNLGGLYHLYPDVAAETGDVTRAETVLRWALCLEPDHPDALSNLAARREAEGALSLAVTLYRRALALAPEHGEAHYNLANSLRDLGDTPGAEAAFRQALALMPHHAGAQWNLGLLRLENHGPGRERWRRYGWRLPQSTQAPGTGLQASPPPPLPLWSADSPAGSRPLLWREQGVGDEILFSALYGAVLARTATTPFPAAVIACDPRLVTLFARSFPAAQVVAAPPDGTPFPSSDSALTVADHQIAAGSLAATLCPTLGTLVATLPAAARTATWTTAWTAAGSAPPAITGSETRSAGWLVPDPSRQARWAARLTALGPEPKIGIAWRSGLANGRRAGSYRPLRDWGAVLTVPGVTFVTLQYGATAATLRDAEQRFGVHIHRWPDLDLRDDFEESAALTAALDLVITAPTAAGELAGALGVPTWRITPCGDWSVLGTAVRPYHPAMRLFQPRPGEGLEQALSRAGMALRRLLLPAIPYSGSP